MFYQMGVTERPVVREKAPLKEWGDRPRPTFHGMLVTPESTGVLPDGKRAIATFNAALFGVPNNKTHKSELLSIFRVQTDEHRKMRADGTSFFGTKRIKLTPLGLEISDASYIDGRSILAPEDIGKNPEDMRLSYDSVTHQVYGALTETMQIANEDYFNLKGVHFPPGKENDVRDIPLVATVVGTPQFNAETGSVEGVKFDRTQFAFEKIEGEERPRMLVGKNAWVEYTHDGGKLLRYRPETIQGKTNQTHVRTLFWGGDGFWHRVKEYEEEGVYPTETIADLIPQGNTLVRFGLNGRTLSWNDKTFRIDHIASISPEDSSGKRTIEYGFITVDGNMKPLLSYDDAVMLSGANQEDLSGEKRVIYCNGYEIVGNRLVMAVTLFDRSIGIFSYGMEELTRYATEGQESEFLQKTFPLHQNERRSALK